MTGHAVKSDHGIPDRWLRKDCQENQEKLARLNAFIEKHQLVEVCFLNVSRTEQDTWAR